MIVPPGSRALDAGCGGGRNLVFMMRSGMNVYGVDLSLRREPSIAGCKNPKPPQPIRQIRKIREADRR